MPSMPPTKLWASPFKLFPALLLVPVFPASSLQLVPFGALACVVAAKQLADVL